MVAEAVLSVELSSPLVSESLLYVSWVQQSAAFQAVAAPLVQKFFGPTIRLMKTSGDQKLVALGLQLSAATI